MTIDVSDALGDDDLICEEYDVIRRSSAIIASGDAAGEVLETFSQPFKISASKQPVGPRDLEALPEGLRDSHPIKIYSRDELFSDANDSTTIDYITVDAKTYRVVAVNDWAKHGYTKAMAVMQSGPIIPE